MIRKNRKVLDKSLDALEESIETLRFKLEEPNFNLALTTNDMRILMVSLMSYLLVDLDYDERYKASNIYQQLGESIYGSAYGFSDYEQSEGQEQI